MKTVIEKELDSLGGVNILIIVTVGDNSNGKVSKHFDDRNCGKFNENSD